MARVMWTDQALDDLKAIHALLYRDAPSYAELLVEALFEQGELLADDPHLGVPVPHAHDDDVRAVGHGPYRLFYHEAAAGEVHILAACPACL